MTEQKPISEAAKLRACELANAGRREGGHWQPSNVEAMTTNGPAFPTLLTLARMLEAFSEAVSGYFGVEVPSEFAPFILPDPVDPLLIEARKLCADADPNKAYQFLEGQRDDYGPMTTVLAALRRGMELAREITP